MKTKISKPTSIDLILLFLLLGTFINLYILFFIPFVDEKILVSDISFVVLNIFSVVALLIASSRSKKTSRTVSHAWLFIALAELSFVIGDLLWLIYEGILHIEPYPSIADLFYLVYYPFLLYGIFLFPRENKNKFDQTKKWLDALIVLLTTSLLLWVYLIDPLVSDLGNETILIKFLAIAYPAGDLVLFASLLILIYNYPQDKTNTPLIFLIASIVVQIVTDILFSVQTLADVYVSGGWLDSGWILGYLFLGVAGVIQSKADEATSGKSMLFYFQKLPFSKYIEKAWVSLPYITVVLSYVFLVVYEVRGNSSNHLFHVLVVGIIILLVMIRQYLVIFENDELNNQLEDALSELREKSSILEKTNDELKREVDLRKRTEEQLSFDALHDSLTQLPNRTLFLDRLNHAFDFTKRNKECAFSVLFLDIDNFKSINDSMGHFVGNELLIQFASRIKECLRKSDTFARLGGDEFVILLEDQVARAESIEVSNRIQDLLKKPFEITNQEFYITTSIGIVNEETDKYENAEDILRDADIAMYHAKELGKAQYQIFNAPLRTEMLSRIKLESQMRSALYERRFSLHYQPIFSIENDKLVGFEALIRWDHPQYGLLYPADFLSLAENSDLIVHIGEWVLSEACAQMKRWINKFPKNQDLTISVNLSGKQLKQKNLVNILRNVLSATELPAKNLHLEITETAMIENQEFASKTLSELHELGIEIQIDDFGAGYSSIGYLQRFPVDTIKIDKCFIQDLGINYKGTQIVLSMIQIANDLGIKIIAEGIETTNQLEKLKTLSCQYGQGFLFSKPLPPQNLEELLISNG